MSINCFSLFLVVGVANSFFLVSHRKYNSFGSSINLATFFSLFHCTDIQTLFIEKWTCISVNKFHNQFQIQDICGNWIRLREKKCLLKKKHEKWRNDINGTVIWSEVIWMDLTTGPRSAERWKARFLVLKAKVRLYSSLEMCEAVFPSLLWIWFFLGFSLEMFQKPWEQHISWLRKGISNLALLCQKWKFRLNFVYDTSYFWLSRYSLSLLFLMDSMHVPQ